MCCPPTIRALPSVDVVGVVVAAESVPGVQAAVQRKVEVVVPDELPQVGRAEIVFLCAESVLEVEGVDAQLVRHDHIGVVRHPAGHPVVAADGLEPPDLVHVLKGDAVHLIGAVLLQQSAQTKHALPGRVDVGQDEVDDVLLADAAGHFRLTVLRGLVDHQRVRAQHPGVEVMVSVAVMPTLAALTPEAAQMPLPSTALGIAVIRRALPGRGISTWERTDL